MASKITNKMTKTAIPTIDEDHVCDLAEQLGLGQLPAITAYREATAAADELADRLLSDDRAIAIALGVMVARFRIEAPGDAELIDQFVSLACGANVKAA